VLVSPPSLVPQLAASIVGSLDILSKTAHIRGRTNPTISRTQGAQIKARETWQIIQRATILRRLANILHSSGHYTGGRAGYDGYVSCGKSPNSHSLWFWCFTYIHKQEILGKYCIPCTESREGFIIHSPRGQIFTKEVAFNVPVTLAERNFPTNMIVLKGQDIDVILGMNWLAQHKTILNTDLRTIRLSYGHEKVLLSIPVAIPAKPFGRVYEAIIPEIQDIPVVCEFPYVFPEDLPGLPPERDVEFVIELKLGTAPISRRSYRMPPNELAELKTQLQDLLEKGFIRPSSSPWDASQSLSRRRIKHFGCVWTTNPLMRSQSRTSTLFPGLISYLISLPELGYFPKLTSGWAIIRSVSDPKIHPRPHLLHGTDYLNIWLCLSD
jgi:hypothetical protein